jgi:hypothetical protein
MRRVAIIFARFVGDNRGSALFAVLQEYTLAAPVVGFLTYDASEGADYGQVLLRAMGTPRRVVRGKGIRLIRRVQASDNRGQKQNIRFVDSCYVSPDAK